MKDILISQYFKEYYSLPIIDVRSPGEFVKGHIPGVRSIPLFSNEERAHIGTVYKYEGQEKAIDLGYKYVTPKLQWYVDEAMKVAPGKKVVVHCWRGGMRSHAFAEHLEKNGFDEVLVVERGYKAFRNYVLDFFEQDVDLKVIGGYTGSGKTYILQELKNIGCQVVDLEELANHKGSAFGAIGKNAQPTVEQFENDLFNQWKDLDLNKPVFVEDESHNIGKVRIPMGLFSKIREAQVYFLDIPKEQRAELLVDDYTGFDDEMLKEAICKISKRLGGLVTQKALKALESKDYFEVAMLTLFYYDKSYLAGVLKRDTKNIVKVDLETIDAKKNAEVLYKLIV